MSDSALQAGWGGGIEAVLRSNWILPIWLTIIIVLVALAFSFGIYATERGRAGRRMRIVLATLRFCLFALLLWMLAGWTWLRFQSDLPELAILLDTSASMAVQDIDAGDLSGGSNGPTRLEWVRTALAKLPAWKWETLRESYDLRWFEIAEGVGSLPSESVADWIDAKRRILPDGKHSRLGEGLQRVIERQAGRGTAAIVFFSDGINTAGSSLDDAALAARRAAMPIHTVAIGKRFAQPDLRLSDLLMDSDVYLGDQVTLQASVIANDIAPTETKIALLDQQENRLLDETTVELSENRNQQTIRLSFVPEKPGTIPLKLQVKPVAGETELDNNVIIRDVNVRDEKIRVMLVQELPTYEFRFLKNLLQRTKQRGGERSASFEIDSVLQTADPEYVQQDDAAIRLVPSTSEEIEQYDVFVFGDFDPQLIARSSQQAIYEAVTVGGAGCLFYSGHGGALTELEGWPLEKLLPVTGKPRLAFGSSVGNGDFEWTPTSLGRTALPMQLAASVEESMSIWSSLPRLDVVAEVQRVNVGAQVLAIAESEQSNLQLPLLVSQFAGAGRVVFQGTDETYRWTSFDGSDLYHQRYWGQMLRWLSRGKLRESSEKSMLKVDPKQVRFGQSVQINVMLGVPRGDTEDFSVPPSSVAVTIRKEEGANREIILPRTTETSRGYQGAVSDLSPGNYRAMLLRPALDVPPTADFSVTAPPGEQAKLQADWEQLGLLAKQSRGKAYTMRDLEGEIEQVFDELPSGKATRLGALPPEPLWNQPWVALLFVVLITTEWLLRRKCRML